MTKSFLLFFALASGFLSSIHAFSPSQSVGGAFRIQYRQYNNNNYISHKNVPKSSHNRLAMATVPPSESSKVGVIGSGFMSIAVAKIAAVSGYQTWLVSPPGEEDTIRSLIGTDETTNQNLQIILGSDSEGVDGQMRESDALMVAVDGDAPMSLQVMKYLLSPEVAVKLKRVVAMSRNLNGDGMGFLVKAAKASAFKGVWDGSTSSAYKEFEQVLREQTAQCGAEYTVVRAGTLKGGGCGEDNEDGEKFDQYLSEQFYAMVRKDIVNWQLLFDCNIRGVKLAKGDVLPGPGVKAVFTATSAEECLGDTGRCGLAEAMVRSLSSENCANIDFGVGTAEGRNPPTDTEWQQLFESLS